VSADDVFALAALIDKPLYRGELHAGGDWRMTLGIDTVGLACTEIPAGVPGVRRRVAYHGEQLPTGFSLPFSTSH